MSRVTRAVLFVLMLGALGALVAYGVHAREVEDVLGGGFAAMGALAAFVAVVRLLSGLVD